MNNHGFDSVMFSEELRMKMKLREKSGISSLLVPACLIEHLEKRIIKFKGLPRFFSHLIKRFRIVLNSLARDPEALKTLYQHKNQELSKVSFRPLEEDWAEIGMFSVASGRSRCLLFVILLLFDIAKFGSTFKKAGFPINYPFSSKKSLELNAVFGVDRQSRQCIRGFSPIEIRPYSDERRT